MHCSDLPFSAINAALPPAVDAGGGEVDGVGGGGGGMLVDNLLRAWG